MLFCLYVKLFQVVIKVFVLQYAPFFLGHFTKKRVFLFGYHRRTFLPEFDTNIKTCHSFSNSGNSVILNDGAVGGSF